MTEPDPDPYDSHPALRDRLKALEALPERPGAGPESPASSLLAGMDRLERA